MAAKTVRQYVWPQMAPMHEPNPEEPTLTLNPSRVLVGQRLTSGGYVIDYLAGASNSDGFASGTYYTIISASPPTKIG